MRPRGPCRGPGAAVRGYGEGSFRLRRDNDVGVNARLSYAPVRVWRPLSAWHWCRRRDRIDAKLTGFLTLTAGRRCNTRIDHSDRSVVLAEGARVLPRCPVAFAVRILQRSVRYQRNAWTMTRKKITYRTKQPRPGGNASVGAASTVNKANTANGLTRKIIAGISCSFHAITGRYKSPGWTDPVLSPKGGGVSSLLSLPLPQQGRFS